MAAQGRKLVVLSLLLAVVQRVAGQDLLIGNSRPCEDVVGADPDPNNPTDNLSCPRLDTELQCYPEAQLCDGVEQCAGGSDEGTNLVALTCEGKLVILIFKQYKLPSDQLLCTCSPTKRERVFLHFWRRGGFRCTLWRQPGLYRWRWRDNDTVWKWVKKRKMWSVEQCASKINI